MGYGTWRQKAALREGIHESAGKVYTQTCSECGHVMEGKDKIPLGVEEWTCPVCGMHHMRDFYSAKNVLQRSLALKAMQIQ